MLLPHWTVGWHFLSYHKRSLCVTYAKGDKIGSSEAYFLIEGILIMGSAEILPAHFTQLWTILSKLDHSNAPQVCVHLVAHCISCVLLFSIALVACMACYLKSRLFVSQGLTWDYCHYHADNKPQACTPSKAMTWLYGSSKSYSLDASHIIWTHVAQKVNTIQTISKWARTIVKELFQVRQCVLSLKLIV